MNNITNFDLNTFEINPDAFPELQLLLSVKSFDLQAIRKRYLKSKDRAKGGSIQRREPARGGLVYMRIKEGKAIENRILAEYNEARGLDFKKGKLLISSENTVYLIDSSDHSIRKFFHPWFSYIHTVKFNSDCSRFLVASSGVDTILELDSIEGGLISEWNAWEHGMDRGENPESAEKHFLTRDAQKAEKLREQGKKVILIQNPQTEKLPTALRAAFINSAEYDSNGQILLTFFHEGCVKKTGFDDTKMLTVLDGMHKPHGARVKDDVYLVTDTAGGRVRLKDKNSIRNFEFRNLEGKSPDMKDMEWLQTSHFIDDIIVTIDSNRQCLSFFHPEQKNRMSIPVNSNWAVQDLVRYKGDIESLEKLLQNSGPRVDE